MTPEMLMARVSGQSIALADPIGGATPQWTVVEAGWGFAWLREPYQSAFRFRHGRDGSGYRRLRKNLHQEAQRLAWCERWKQRIHGIEQVFYLDEIVTWVLAEETMSYPDRQRLLDALIRAYPPDVYERELLPKQRSIAAVLDRWCSIAHEHVARRIRVDGDDLDDNEINEILDTA